MFESDNANQDSSEPKKLEIPVRFINPEKQYDYVQSVTVSSNLKPWSLYNFPIINTIYDEFLDEPIMSNERIENLVMVSTLLSGLFLGAVMGIPMSVEFSEVQDARERFSKAPYNATRWKAPVIIKELSMYTTAAVYTLGASMCGIVVFYLLAGMESSNSENTPRRIRESWWYWNKSIIFFIFVSTLFGMVASFLAFNRFAFIKFPDLWVENNGKEVNGTWTTKGRAVDFPSGRTSTYGSYLSWGYFYLILSIIVSMIVMSFTRCMRNKKEEQVYDVYNKKMKKWITNRGKILQFLNTIVKIWDMEDQLPDANNPFLLNLEKIHQQSKENLNQKVSPHTTKNGRKSYGARVDENRGIRDPRVRKAFGVIQLADYAKWETFIRDYKGNDKLFKDFSSRWRISFGIFAEKWKEEKKETIHEKCKIFVEGKKTTDEENATFKSILEKEIFSEVSA